MSCAFISKRGSVSGGTSSTSAVAISFSRISASSSCFRPSRSTSSSPYSTWTRSGGPTRGGRAVDKPQDHEVAREAVVHVQLVAVRRVGRDQAGISETLGDERAALVGEPVADGGNASPGLSAEQDSAEA